MKDDWTSASDSHCTPPPLSLEAEVQPDEVEERIPAPAPDRFLPVDPATGQLLPPGSALVLIGRGGLGEVRAAWDSTLERMVAVKTIASDGAGGQGMSAVTRFLREARITARLEHPAIVPIHELGRLADGTLYYAMRLVRGRTLKAALRERATLDRRLGLLNHFVDLCQAIACAHASGIVHRDIKPENVMVGAFGETVVLDWGIAAARGEVVGGAVSTPLQGGRTVAGAVLGTPGYMSPEQAAGRSAEADPRSDVWSLGAVLFELLTGRRLLEDENPDTLMKRAREGRVPRVRAVCPEAPPELAAVADRALSAERDLRYPDAGALAADVEAWRSGALVEAYRYSTLDRLRRFFSRHRTAVMVGALSLGLLLIGGVVALVRIVAERDRAVAAEQEAVASRDDATRSLADSLVIRAQGAWKSGALPEAWLTAARSLTLAEDPDARGLVLAALHQYSPVMEGEVALPDGCKELLAARYGGSFGCSDGHALHLWDSRGEPRIVALPEALRGGRLALGPGMVAAENDRKVYLLQLDRDAPPLQLPDPAGMGVSNLVFSPDGRHLYGLGGSVSLPTGLVAWEVASGRLLGRDPQQAAMGLDISPDGHLLAIGGTDALHLLRATDLQPLGRIDLPDRQAWEPRFSPDGRMVAFASEQGGSYIARAEPGAEMIEIPGNGGPGRLVWTPDGSRLVDLREDRRMRLVRARDGAVVFHFPPGDGAWSGNTILPDGRLVAPDDAGRLRVWNLGDAAASDGLFSRAAAGSVLSMSPQSPLVLSSPYVQDRGPVLLWELPSGRAVAELAPTGFLASIAPDGTAATWMDEEKDALVVARLPDQSIQASWPRDGAIWLGWTSDSSRLMAVRPGGRLLVHDPQTGALLREIGFEAGGFTPFAPGDGASFIVPGPDDTLLRLDLETGESRELARLDDGILVMVDASGGGSVVLGHSGGGLSLVSLPSGKLLSHFQAHPSWTRRVAASADGSRAASSSRDHVVHLWALPEGRLLARMDVDGQRVHDLEFSPDGRVLYGITADGRVRGWAVDRAEEDPAVLLAEAEARFGLEIEGARVLSAHAEARPLADWLQPARPAPKQPR